MFKKFKIYNLTFDHFIIFGSKINFGKRGFWGFGEIGRAHV